MWADAITLQSRKSLKHVIYSYFGEKGLIYYLGAGEGGSPRILLCRREMGNIYGHRRGESPECIG